MRLPAIRELEGEEDMKRAIPIDLRLGDEIALGLRLACDQTAEVTANHEALA